MKSLYFYKFHDDKRRAELRINGMRRINHWGDLLDCDDVKFLSGQLLTNRGLCEARAAIRSYSTREREADVGETQCGGELRECTKPLLSRGNRGVLCAFRHRSIMHRVHDRPTDRLLLAGPFGSRTPRRFPSSNIRRLFRGVYMDSNNISERRIYE